MARRAAPGKSGRAGQVHVRASSSRSRSKAGGRIATKKAVGGARGEALPSSSSLKSRGGVPMIVKTIELRDDKKGKSLAESSLNGRLRTTS